MIESFPYIADSNSKILILGTMPGKKSLELNQYYGHGGNHFWKLMFDVLNKSFSHDYSNKTTLLLNRGIALWDVLMHCEREGSADSKIEKEQPNDFESFFSTHDEITHVFFNGKNAQAYYEKYIGLNKKREYVTLPSTSRANSWYTYDEKISEWQKITQCLNLKK